MQEMRFDDGDAYERGMAPWSRLAGETSSTWLAPSARLAMARRWMWNGVICGVDCRTMRSDRNAGDRSKRRTACSRAHAAGHA